MSKGWVSIHRRILEDCLWLTGTSAQKLLMITAILKANNEPNEWVWKGDKYTVRRGQFITSIEKLQKAIGKSITRQNIRTALKNLKKYGFLTDESTKTGRLITVLNYTKYQDNQKGANIETNHEVTDRSPTGNQQVTPNNKDNNDDNISLSIPKKKFDEDSIELKLSKHLFKKISKNNPNAKEPNFQLWARNIDLMIRIDKRKPDDIKKVIEWCQQDSFWHKNILSTEKLRKQYDQLVMNIPKVKKQFKNERTYSDEERARIEKNFYS